MTTFDVESVEEIAASVPAGLERALPNYWYPILQSEELPETGTAAGHWLDMDLVAWRGPGGVPQVVRDRCPHRAAKLSKGRVLEGQLQCAFHGLRFDGDGACVLIPWEEENESADELRVRSFPAQELGGYVWAYLGDAEVHPPPALQDELPTELSRPSEFVWYRMPTEVWDTNWLIAIDGSDAFHAVTLHAESQAVSDGKWEGGGAERPTVALEDRRVRITETPYGIRGVSTDLNGNPLHHGHVLKDVQGARFVIPCLTTNPIVPVPGVPPYVARLWQFPAGENRTQIVRYVVWRRSDVPEDLDLDQLVDEVVRPRVSKVSREDAEMAAAQGDLVSARAEEHLLEPDVDMFEVREVIKEAYLAGVAGDRIAPQADDLIFPLAANDD